MPARRRAVASSSTSMSRSSPASAASDTGSPAIAARARRVQGGSSSTSRSTTPPGSPTSRSCRTRGAQSVTGFLVRALRWFKRQGIRVERVMTDNGSGYVSRLFRKVCRLLHLRHIRTRPYTPKTNGKPERFIQTLLREWACRTAARTAAPPTCPDGCATTIRSGPMLASPASHPPPGSRLTPEQRARKPQLVSAAECSSGGTVARQHRCHPQDQLPVHRCHDLPEVPRQIDHVPLLGDMPDRVGTVQAFGEAIHVDAKHRGEREQPARGKPGSRRSRICEPAGRSRRSGRRAPGCERPEATRSSRRRAPTWRSTS